MKKIENWFITPGSSDPYLAPELRQPRLGGINEDGLNIVTSPIQGLSLNGNILTMNTEYELGEADPNYEAAFPDAKDRLLASLIFRDH